MGWSRQESRHANPHDTPQPQAHPHDDSSVETGPRNSCSRGDTNVPTMESNACLALSRTVLGRDLLDNISSVW